MLVTAVLRLKNGIILCVQWLVARHKSAASHLKIIHFWLYEMERGDFQCELRPSILRRRNHRIHPRQVPGDSIDRLVRRPVF